MSKKGKREGTQPITTVEVKPERKEEPPLEEIQGHGPPADKQEISDAITIFLANNQPVDYQKLADELIAG